MRPSEENLVQSILDSWSSMHGLFAAVRELPLEVDEKIASLFTPRERELLEAHRHQGRRRSWVGGRLAAREALRRWCIARGQSPRGWEILREPSGRPAIAGRPDLHVSISHSGTLAVAVVGNRPVGVDLEAQDERPDALARAFFSEPERRWMRDDPPQARRRCNELWTRKEAVSKLLGQGGTLSFSALSVLDGHTPWCLDSASTASYAISLALPGEC